MSGLIDLKGQRFSSWEVLERGENDGDGLNCRRSNMRLATHGQNAVNSAGRGVSPFKGVSFHLQRGKWRARITKDGFERHIGLFDSEQEASAAYMAEASKLHGDFARAL